MKIEIAQARRMHSALLQLNGRSRVIEQDGKAVQAAVEHYAFPSQTRVNIIHNIRVLEPVLELINQGIKDIIKRISADGTTASIDANPVLLKQFNEEQTALLKSDFTAIGLTRIRWADLDMAKVDAVTVFALGKMVPDVPKIVNVDELLEDPEAKPATSPSA